MIGVTRNYMPNNFFSSFHKRNMILQYFVVFLKLWAKIRKLELKCCCRICISTLCTLCKLYSKIYVEKKIVFCCKYSAYNGHIPVSRELGQISVGVLINIKFLNPSQYLSLVLIKARITNMIWSSILIIHLLFFRTLLSTALPCLLGLILSVGMSGFFSS